VAAIAVKPFVVGPDELPPHPATGSSSERQRQRNEECSTL
jgi:hypothetical protein